jgi:prevent-host-death family protein
MVEMTMSEARKAWAAVLDRVESGEAITITRHGREVAVVAPPPSVEDRLSPAVAEALGTLRAGLARAQREQPDLAAAISVDRAEELVAAIRAERDG